LIHKYHSESKFEQIIYEIKQKPKYLLE